MEEKGNEKVLLKDAKSPDTKSRKRDMDESDNEEELVIDTSPNTRSKNKNKNRSRKRKRLTSTSSTEFVLTSNTLELEKNLQASALKNNLDDTSVKKIIKKVVTNDHVLALVKLREEEEASSTDEDIPTLTRSKAKTIKKVPRVTAPWNLQLEPIEHIPVKTRPEVEALIAQELPDDEDDEEYNPTNDDIPSDDDHIESCSDLESQPRTPATPRPTEESPKVVKDGPFVVPQVSKVSRQLNLEEDATIALRTRSKLSLSSTPIEHIESSFVPPDELPQTDVDEIWNDFLKECLNPAPNAHEDDDDADPEYNVAADPDATEDEESLEKSIIKISKKELEDILTELCQVMPQPEKDIQNTQEAPAACVAMETQVQWKGKREIVSDEEKQSTPIFARRMSIGKTEPMDDEVNEEIHQEQAENCVQSGKDNIVPITQGKAPPKVISHATAVKPTPPKTAPPKPTPPKPTPPTPAPPKDVTMAVEEGVAELLQGGEGDTPAVVKIVTNTTPEVVVNIDETVKFLPEQRLLLEQQLRQHVQLCASNFMQVCVNPKHWGRAATFKEYLKSLNKIADENPSSVVNVCNLRPALDLIIAYEESVTEVTPENQEMVKFMADEMDRMSTKTSNKYIYRGKFPQRFKAVVASSSVFLYPYLLPPSPFRPHTTRRMTYLRSEDELIALGLDEFFWYVEHNPELYRLPRLPGRRGLQAATALVCRYLMPWMSPNCLAAHIFTVRRSKDVNNPIYKFIKNRTVEPVKHKLLPFDPTRTLYDQPEHEMPRSWVVYLAKTNKRFRSYLYKRSHVNGAEPVGVEIDGSKILNNYPPKSTSLPIAPIRKYRGNEKKDEVTTQEVTTTPTLTVATRVYNLVTTSNGIMLVPQTTPQATVATSVITTPICSVVENPPTVPTPTITIDNGKLITPPKVPSGIQFVRIAQRPQNITSKPASQNSEQHCRCCKILRKMKRTRQTLITDFIRGAKRKTCPCQSIKRPQMTNKLKLLIKYYATYSKTVYSHVKSIFEQLKGISAEKVEETSDESVDKEKDTAFAISFIMKLSVHMNMSKTMYRKQRIDEILQAFDVHNGNPLYLAADLHKILGQDEMELYREFMAFLTPDQADRLEKFRDHFIGNCMEDYMKKIEECIPNKDHRCAVTELLLSMFGKKTATACEWCCGLLENLRDYPALAEYTFYLFPHRRKTADNFYKKSTCTNNNKDCNKDEEDATVNNNEEENLSRNSIKQKIITKRTPNILNNKENNRISKIVAVDSNNGAPKIINNKQINETIKIVNDKPTNETPKMVLNKPNIEEPESTKKKLNRKKQTLRYSETSSSEEEASMSDGSTTEDDDETDCGDDQESSKEVKKEPEGEIIMEEGRGNPVELLSEVKEEPADSYEITYTTTEVQHRVNENPQSVESVAESEVNVKIEPLEWKREEDKLLLELMKQSLADGKTKTLCSIVESQSEKFLQCCENRSLLDITKRLFHLLQVVNES
ncbi:uncharacterized protein LOC121736988 [Aricia agestis]|uniref:uncharacterized protein LOC121736988 n=1 Tax=Aricia agestis TaxID=91739 RepID=UPI001C207CD0|nr:uncharacterized protein LOC121736988 [Aricia agestis]